MTEFPYMRVNTTFKNGELQFPFQIYLGAFRPLPASNEIVDSEWLEQDGPILVVSEANKALTPVNMINELYKLLVVHYEQLKSIRVLQLNLLFDGAEMWDWCLNLTNLETDQVLVNIRPAVDANLNLDSGTSFLSRLDRIYQYIQTSHSYPANIL